MSSKLALPIQLWAVVLLIVLLCIVTSSYYSSTITDHQRKILFHLDRLNNNSNKFHIAVLGNSLTYCALPFDTTLQEQLKKNNLDLKVTRITRLGMDSTVFKVVFPELLRFKPNIVFIQSDFFYLNFNRADKQNTLLSDYRKALYGIEDIIRNRLRISQSRNIGAKDVCIDEDQENDKYRVSSIQNLLLKKNYDRLGIELKEYEVMAHFYDFILQAKKTGIKVVFLDMGRSKVVNTFLGKENQLQIKNSLESLSNTTQSKIWRFPENLSLDHYMDFAHLNNLGRIKFTQWFIQQLEKELRSEDSIICESLTQGFCSSSRRSNRRIASYATVATTQKTDKKTSQDLYIIESSLLKIQ